MVATRESVLENLLAFIAVTFLVEKDEINLEESLIDEGIIDSFGLIEIGGFINREYGFQIEEADMQRENFGSVLKIVDFVCRKAGF